MLSKSLLIFLFLDHVKLYHFFDSFISITWHESLIRSLYKSQVFSFSLRFSRLLYSLSICFLSFSVVTYCKRVSNTCNVISFNINIKWLLSTLLYSICIFHKWHESWARFACYIFISKAVSCKKNDPPIGILSIISKMKQKYSKNSTLP